MTGTVRQSRAISRFGILSLAPLLGATPLLTDLARRDIVPIHGIDDKVPPEQAEAWLDELGDPFTRTGADIDGRVGIDWGVYGVPETYIVDADGRTAYRHVGPTSPTVLEQTLLPLVARLQDDKPGRTGE